MATSKTPHTLLVAFAAILTCATGATLFVQYLQWSSVPSDDAWKEAATQTLQHITRDDAFLVEPEWDSRPRQWMEDHTYVPAQNVTWSDISAHKRVFLLTETARIDRAKARLPVGWSITRTLGPQKASPVTVLELGPPDPSATPWDTLSALPKATIWRTYPNRPRQDCKRFVPKPSPSWYCGRQDPYLYVGETLRTLPNDTHRCLWAMPIDAGGTLHIQYKDVPISSTLQGHYGQTIDAIRSKRGTPVHFEILLDDAVIHTKTFAIDEEGYPAFSVDTSQHKGTSKDVTFRVRAQNQVDRFFCFTARSTNDSPRR